MLRFNDIADQMLEYNSGVDLELLQRAYVFSAKVHEGQERLSGEPYLVHPVEVAGILAQMRVDDVTVVAGMREEADGFTSAFSPDRPRREIGRQNGLLYLNTANQSAGNTVQWFAQSDPVPAVERSFPVWV